MFVIVDEQTDVQTMGNSSTPNTELHWVGPIHSDSFDTYKGATEIKEKDKNLEREKILKKGKRK